MPVEYFERDCFAVGGLGVKGGWGDPLSHGLESRAYMVSRYASEVGYTYGYEKRRMHATT